MYPYVFEAEIERFGVGKTRKVWYQVLMLPAPLKETLPFEEFPRLRIEGEIADVPVSSAFIPTGDGRSYVIVGPDVRKAAGVGLGDSVEMRFEIADQDAVHVPEDLLNSLKRNPDMQRLWTSLTPGKRRGMSHYVESAKSEVTRIKRIAAVFNALENFNGDLRAAMNAERDLKSSGRQK